MDESYEMYVDKKTFDGELVDVEVDVETSEEELD